MNVQNLTKLAQYLESLPQNYQDFCMTQYISANLEDELKYVATGVKCGTVACALGHGPAAGIPFTQDHFIQGLPVWDLYEKEFISTHSQFEFLFDDDWEDIDNTHQGAAKRIRYLLQNGSPPNREEWR